MGNRTEMCMNQQNLRHQKFCERDTKNKLIKKKTQLETIQCSTGFHFSQLSVHVGRIALVFGLKTTIM